MEKEVTVAIASLSIFTITFLLGLASSFICRRGRGLRKRQREEDPSIEQKPKHSKLDTQESPSISDVSLEPVPKPEAPLGEELLGERAQLLEVTELPSEDLPMVAPPEGAPTLFDGLPDIIDLGSPDTDLSYEYWVMEEAFFFQIYILVSQIVDRFPLILPDPSRASLFDIVRFTFLNFNEEDEVVNLCFLQEVIQDLLLLGVIIFPLVS